MAGVKGEKRDQSQYETHNWCSKCGLWRKDKPLRCPECHNVTRSHARFKTHSKTPPNPYISKVYGNSQGRY